MCVSLDLVLGAPESPPVSVHVIYCIQHVFQCSFSPLGKSCRKGCIFIIIIITIIILTLWHGWVECRSSTVRDHAHTVLATSHPLRLNLAKSNFIFFIIIITFVYLCTKRRRTGSITDWMDDLSVSECVRLANRMKTRSSQCQFTVWNCLQYK